MTFGPLFYYLCKTNKKIKDMQLELHGQEHSIDANTLVNMLVHYQKIVTEANQYMSGGSREIKLQVNALKQGSFIIDVSVVQNVLRQIFDKDSVAYIADLCGVVGGVYAIYRYFKGKPVKTDEDKKNAVSIKIDNVNVNIDAVKLYNTPAVRQAISKSMETANEDPSVSGFAIKSNKGTDCAVFERKEFKEYIYDGFDSECVVPGERTIEEETTLVIVGLNFEPGSRWLFMYNGFKIPIRVKDDALMQQINEGERFGKGDAIRVKLRRIQSFNTEIRTYENKSYKIIEFYEHIKNKQPSNQELFE